MKYPKFRCSKCGSSVFEEGFTIESTSNFIWDIKELKCGRCGEILVAKCSVCDKWHAPIKSNCLTADEKKVRGLEKVNQEIRKKEPPYYGLIFVGCFWGFAILGVGLVIECHPVIFIGGCLIFLTICMALCASTVKFQKFIERKTRQKFPELFQKKEELEREIKRTKKR
ncbi:MAG: hypothetical protein PHE59_02600 [Patescibacteria group bacterium]|nr:hypothetical protein [Patescibacteria group bacterium]MDD5164348.1 hypothetical protein [Patescibacteria group bacterium]MDD5534284.1 hypothetical protein [Patescibacteria group bacterium]